MDAVAGRVEVQHTLSQLVAVHQRSAPERGHVAVQIDHERTPRQSLHDSSERHDPAARERLH